MRKYFVPFLLVSMIVSGFLGCQTAKATKTQTYQDQAGHSVTNTDSIAVSSFLGIIHNGAYSNGGGMTLTVTDATPDSQTIGVLAGGVIKLAEIAVAAKNPTNATPVSGAPESRPPNTK